MTKFIILRHGYSIYNKLRKFTGQSDIPLDDIGHRQAELAGKYITENYKIDKIYSSDLKRAVDTAKPVSDILNIPIETQKDLREIDVGKWQDVEIDYVIEHFAEDYKKYKEAPHIVKCGVTGENYTQLMERASNVFSEMAEQNDGKTVLVATHGGLIKSIFCAWNNVDASEIGKIKIVNNASVTEVDFHNGSVDFIKIGFDKYLDEKTEF